MTMEIIARHYETLRASYDGCEVYEEVQRYTTTTFTMKRRNLTKDNRGKQIFHFFKP